VPQREIGGGKPGGQATGVERKNLANAVSSVNAEQLSKSPTASVEQSLQGKLAGAQITNNTFAPGGGVMVRLRGVTSINGTFTPLYVVDGVIVSDAAVAPGNNFITQSAPGTALTGNTDGPVNRIADINPSDIENIEVLKGASASAMQRSYSALSRVLLHWLRRHPCDEL
jgi:outer membrane receptor protein involved in Fe transport